jgi:predicted N-acetyltransferase YhbS
MNAYWTRQLFRGRPDLFLVAREDDAAVGFAGLTVQEAFGIGCLVHIGVQRLAQNRGIGQRLVETGLDLFRLRDLRAAWIAYDYGNERASHLYRKLGFTEFAEELFFDRDMAPTTGASLAVRVATCLDDLAQRLPAGRTWFAEEDLNRIHSLGLDPDAVRRQCLRDKMSGGVTAYVPAVTENRTAGFASGDDESFVIAGREADGPVLRLAMTSAGEPAAGPALIAGVLDHHRIVAAGSSKPAFRAAYAESYRPADGWVAGLETAGLRRAHHLICLSQSL